MSEWVREWERERERERVRKRERQRRHITDTCVYLHTTLDIYYWIYACAYVCYAYYSWYDVCMCVYVYYVMSWYIIYIYRLCMNDIYVCACACKASYEYKLRELAYLWFLQTQTWKERQMVPLNKWKMTVNMQKILSAVEVSIHTCMLIYSCICIYALHIYIYIHTYNIHTYV